MELDEQSAKELLEQSGIRVPRGGAASSSDAAARLAHELGTPVVIKPLIRAGRRGKAGLIRFADDPDGVRAEADDLLKAAPRVRVEERVSIRREHYVAVVTDRSARCPVILYSDEGGIDVETARRVVREPVDIRRGLSPESLAVYPEAFRELVAQLYERYRTLDAELVEVNPLAETDEGELIALDAKLVVDDSALARQPSLDATPASGTPLEERARAAGLYYIELEGDVGVLANGAGLTMATLDAVRFFGGRPANFMEIGGDAYHKAREALDVVLGNPNVESLLVNLCGAYARTDVMVEGLLAGWEALRPDVPVAFSIHGTGEARARQMVRDALGLESFDAMDDAVKAAIANV